MKIVALGAALILSGCMTFHAKGYTNTGVANWKFATLKSDTPNGTEGHDCSYTVDDTGSRFDIRNRKHCYQTIEIDINSWKLTTVGIPILFGGIQDSGFAYRPAMP